ncbi:hypothetical protein VTK56DRAFT_4271 [Thermocarpiscus australiensis]
MTNVSTPEIYPQYCFHLSPTINRWCHFRIADIQDLTAHPGFQGQDVYFHLNHPIKWVRIAGVVVAVDERETRHIYTIDDSSGAAIECVVNVTPQARPGTSAATAATSGAKSNGSANELRPLPAIDGPIDVGHVLDVKGSVGMFRDMKQIRAEKIVHLRSTEQEVTFWEKVVLLKREVLSRPWVLDRREVRRCRREEEGRYSSRRHQVAGERYKKGQVDTVEVARTKAHHRGTQAGKSHERNVLAKGRLMQTGLERRRATKPATKVIPVTGNYDALGF